MLSDTTKLHVFPAGSSIGMVYDDSDAMLSRVLADGERLSQDMMSKINKSLSNSGDNGHGMLLFNPISCDREEIVQQRRVHLSPFSFLKVSPNKVLSPSDVVGSGDRIDCLNGTEKVSTDFVHCESLGENNFLMENAYIAVRMSARGQIWSILDKRVSPFREVIDSSSAKDPPGSSFGNMLMLYDDVPYFWDAWDVLPYHLQRGRCINNSACSHSSASDIQDIQSVEILFSKSAVTVCITLTHWGDDPRTSLTQRITLNAFSTLLDFDTTVSWFESHKLLKVEFPVSVRSASVAYDIQFGVQYRPTHGNHLTGKHITMCSTTLLHIYTYIHTNISKNYLHSCIHLYIIQTHIQYIHTFNKNSNAKLYTSINRYINSCMYVCM